MPFFETVTADQVITAIIATITMREALIWALPDSVAGPQGWLVRTDDES